VRSVGLTRRSERLLLFAVDRFALPVGAFNLRARILFFTAARKLTVLSRRDNEKSRNGAVVRLIEASNHDLVKAKKRWLAD